MKIFSFKAGNTLDCELKFLEKLKKRGAKVVDSLEKSTAIIVFCPIVSRFETDIKSALSSLPEGHGKRLILVAMHPTFDEDYTLPNHRELDNRAVELLVDCLFFETKGLYKCPRNKKAIESVRKTLDLKTFPKWTCVGKGGDEVKKDKRTNKVGSNESVEWEDQK